MASRTQPNYYTNPAFSQQSEFVNGQRHNRALSPQRNIRHPPVGAQTQISIYDTSIQIPKAADSGGYEEQEFYEEIIVDDEGVVKDKKVVVVSQNNGKKYIELPQNEGQGARYGLPQELNEHRYEEIKSPGSRYEYIPMQEQNSRTRKQYQEEIPLSPSRQHRYAVIDAEEETELSTKSTRYALVPVEELDQYQPTSNQSRYEHIPESPPRNKPSLQRTLSQSKRPHVQQNYSAISENQGRYEYIQNSNQMPISKNTSPVKTETIQMMQQLSIQQQRAIATQKLHELLSTPRKPRTSTPVHSPLSPNSQRRMVSSPVQQISKDPFIVSKPSPHKSARTYTPRAHKKLNYALGSQQLLQEKRNTAIIAPMCSSPIQSVYSETTYSKSSSWWDLKMPRKSAQRMITVAAILLILCGSVNCGLCLHMISKLGTQYYFYFGLGSGFLSMILGLVGLRPKSCYLVPGTNSSGYILLSLFSLSTCASLLILLVAQPKPGTPLADIMYGIVIGISLLSFLVAAYEIVCAYCWRSPPRDNRVEHCSPGFSV